MREHQTARCRVGSFVLQPASVRSSMWATMTVFIVIQTVVATVRMSNGFYRCIRGVFECPMGFVGASEVCESSQSLERSACDRTGLLSAACPWLGCTSGTTRTRTMPTCPRWRHCRFDSTSTRSHCRRLIELVWRRQEITLPTTWAELV